MPLTSRLVARGGRLFTLWSDGTELPYVRGGDGEAPTLAELIAQAADPAAIESDDALAQLDADITAAAEAIDPATLDAEGLAQLQAAAAAVQGLRAEAERREQEAAARTAEATAALAAIRGESADADPDGDEPADGDAADAEDEGDTPAQPATPDATADDGTADQAQPIAASTPPAVPARRRAPLTRVAARRPAAAAPRTPATPSAGSLASLGLVASANAPGVQAGQHITSYDQLASAFLSAVDATRGYRHGPRVKVPVVRVGSETADQYPEGYRLDSNVHGNMDKITAAQALAERGGVRAGIAASAAASLTAAGGICAPQQVNYDLPVVGSDARPVRDQYMTRFGADRGGVRTIPPPSLGDVDDGAVIHWTELNDIDPNNAGATGVPVADRFATKPCLTITCPDEDETIVEAITRCLETGNFRARFFPEQVEAWMRLVTVWQARYAERRLLAAMSANDVAMTQAQVLSSGRDMLTTLDRVVARWRNVFRLDDGFTIQWGAPRWFLDQMRADIARQLPVGTLAETLAVADSEIESFFRTRNVDPVWFKEGETGQDFAAQAAGAVNAWPATVRTYLSAPGAWLFLDGGSLDLGIVRDSTLNGTNDLQMFAETWEGAHFHSALPNETLTLTSCPDGSVSATTAVDTCA